MSDDAAIPNGGDRDDQRGLLSRLSLRPPHKSDHPNPHYRGSPMGRDPLPTPSTVATKVWRTLGVESHVALALLIIPIIALFYYLHTEGVSFVWLGLCAGMVGLSYAIYYAVPPRESRHVIARLENLYHASRFAIVSSGIAFLTVLATLTLITGLLTDEYIDSVMVADTSVTIATAGFTVGMISSYILVRVLVARALPVQSNAPLMDRLVNMSSALELAFVLASLGAPAFIYAAAFLWDRPELFVLPFRITHEVSAIFLLGVTFIYVALVSRL